MGVAKYKKMLYLDVPVPDGHSVLGPGPGSPHPAVLLTHASLGTGSLHTTDVHQACSFSLSLT